MGLPKGGLAHCGGTRGSHGGGEEVAGRPLAEKEGLLLSSPGCERSRAALPAQPVAPRRLHGATSPWPASASPLPRAMKSPLTQEGGGGRRQRLEEGGRPAEQHAQAPLEPRKEHGHSPCRGEPSSEELPIPPRAKRAPRGRDSPQRSSSLTRPDRPLPRSRFTRRPSGSSAHRSVSSSARLPAERGARPPHAGEHCGSREERRLRKRPLGSGAALAGGLRSPCPLPPQRRRRPPRAPPRAAAGLATPLSPTRLSRLQEKEELRQLNDRLAHYIERVRALELENDRLLLRVSEKEEVVTREVTGIKALYESELADTRRVLDETARERAKLQIEIGKLRAEFEELRRSYKKKDGEWSTSQGRIKELEVLFHRSEAELTATLSEKQSLEAEVADARAQLAKAEDAHAVAKRQLEKETLLRVDLENRCQSLQEELDFRKSIFEEEVRETQKWHERHLVETDSGRQREYKSRVAHALEELRRQHDDQVRLYKLELEQTYQAKLESARLCSDQNERAASAAREELNEARIRIEALSYQLSGLQKQVSTAEERMRDLEELMAGEQEKLRKMLDAKEREMMEMREQMQQQLMEYQELLDVKLALDMEISAYRKLLEGEEERLKLSPGPPPRITVSRATSSGASATRCSRGKRKRAEAEELPGSVSGGVGGRTGTSSLQASQQASAKGSVSIEEVDPEGKFVQLKNHSDKDQSLGNWRLKRKVGEGEEIAYKFTPKYVLRAGQTVTIWAAEAGVAHSPPLVLVWKNQGSWGTGDHIHTYLVNADGEEVAVRSLTQLSTVLQENEEDEEDEAEFGEEDLFHQQGDPRTTSRGCAIM
ncbi:lamin-B2 [Candoia aspera]|uniref:lamin-B2 n=1 Tax=Candoia aspera TaxID=51853 RepID=UPI002FD7F81F